MFYKVDLLKHIAGSFYHLVVQNQCVAILNCKEKLTGDALIGCKSKCLKRWAGKREV